MRNLITHSCILGLVTQVSSWLLLVQPIYATANLNDASAVVSIDSVVIQLNSNRIDENIPLGQSGWGGIGLFEDPNNEFTYALVAGEGDTDNAIFEIRNEDTFSQLRTSLEHDYETDSLFSILVQAQVKLNDSIVDTRPLTIEVVNVEEPPTEVILSNSSVEQGAEEDTEVGTLSVTGGALVPIEFSLIGENDDFFALEDNVLKVEDDFEDLASGEYPVTIQATGDGSIDSTFIITVTNEEEPPSNITLSDSTIEENQPVGTIVGTLSASSESVDPENITYSLVAGGDDFSIIGEALQTKRVFDFEEDPETYLIEVVAQGGGDSDPTAFTITLTNVIELPPAFDLDNKSVAENQPFGSLVGTFVPVDSTVTYSLVAGTGDEGNFAFSIVNQTSGSQLQTVQVLDYEDQDSYSIRVSAANAEGTRDTTFTLAVVDEVENTSPVANAGVNIIATDTDRNGSEEVTLDASGSTDDKGIVRYLWTMPDATILADTPEAITEQEVPVGTFDITLTVFDEEGEDSTNVVNVIVNQPPTAVAGSDLTSGEVPLTVAFSSAGSIDDDGSIASYEWNFGDGETSTEESPTYTYTLAGTYLVMLTVTDDYNATAKDSVEITVDGQNQAPTAEATATPTSGTAPLQVAFSSEGSEDEDGLITYSWDFGDGNSNEDASPTHTYDDPGEYTATLTVTDDDLATASDSVTIAVNAPPIAEAGDEQTVDAEEGGFANVALDGSKSEDIDGTIIRYDWREDVETGRLLATSEEPTVTLQLPIGEHLIALVVEDNDMATASDAVMIYVDEPQNVAPIAAASANITSGAAPLEVVFSSDGSEDGDGTIESYLWDFGDGGTSTAASASHIYNSAGTYSAILAVTDNDEATTISDAILIEVTAALAPEFTLSPNPVTVDEDFSGQQRVEAQLTDNTQDVTFSIEPPTLDFATLTADNSNGIYLFESSPNSNGNANLTVRATDNATQQTYEQTLSIEVAAVNDAPVFTLTDDEVTVVANSERQTVANFATNIAPGPAEATDESGQTVSFSVSTDNQGLFSEQPGISPEGSLTYQVAENQAGSTNVSVILQDNGAFDGANVNASDLQSFTLNVEAPQATNLILTGNTVPENKDSDTEIGVLSFQGFALGPSYSLPAGQADNNRFKISDDKLLTSQPLDFEERTPAEYQVVVEATSVFPGGTVSETFTIIITDVEEPPTLVELDGETFDEGQAVGTTVGTLSASGGSVPSDDVTFSLVSGGDDFVIVDNELRTARAFDFESDPETYTIEVIAQGEGDSESFEFEITLTNIDESVAPTTISITNTTISEGGMPIAVGTLSADGTAPITFSLVAGVGDTDNDKFEIIDGTTLQTTTAIDFEDPTTADGLTVRVQASNATGEFAGTFAITVTNVAEPPELVQLDGQSFDEGQDIGTRVGTLSASGGSVPPDDVTFSLVSGGDNFEIVGNELRTARAFDFETETETTYNIEVIARGDGSSDPQEFTITLIDVDESVAPDAINLDNNSITEGDAGITVGTLSSNGTEPVTLSLVAGEGDADNDKFEINGTALVTTVALDFEDPTTADGLSVRIQATNTQGSFASVIAITVTNVEEPPTDITLAGSTVQENQEDAIVGTLDAVGGAEPIMFSLVGSGNNNDEFVIDGDELKTKDGLDFEAGPTRQVTVRATANNDGSLDRTFTITVENQVEAPTDITLDKNSVDENQVNGLVGNLATVEGQEPFSFSLTGRNNDNNLFIIDGTQLKTRGSLNFEETPSPTVEITVNSSDGSFTKEFTIIVNNLEEPPTEILLSSSSVNENEPRNTLVGRLSVEGGSVANPTFQFVGNRNDNGFFRISNNQLLTNAVFDRESRASYNIRIRALGEGSIARNFTINIDNVNDAPTITVTEDQIPFAEGGEPVIVLQEIVVEDEDNPELSSATLSFVNNYVRGEDELLTNADHQWNNQAGRLTINGPLPIAELQNILRNVTYQNKKTINPTSSARQIRVVVNDGALNSNTEQIFILVDNPNVPPVLTDFLVEVSEDASRTFTATDFESNHADADDDFPNQIYLESGPAEGVLTVDGQIITSEVILSSGAQGFLVDFATVESVIYSPAEDFSGNDEFRWNVRDDDNAGNSALVKIEVLPTNDAPQAFPPDQLVVQENTPLALSDIILSDVDDDVLLLTLSVTNGFLLPSPSVEGEVVLLETGEDGSKGIQIEGVADDLAAIIPQLTYIPASEISDKDSLVIVLTDSPSNVSGEFITNATVNIQIGINQPPQVSNISLEINSGQVFPFTENVFLEAYADPDNFPEETGFSAILISSLPEIGHLIFNEDTLNEEQLGTGFLIAREDIPNLSYHILSNNTDADQFKWNATDGGKLAQEEATVSFAIKLLSITLAADIEEVCLGESATLTTTIDGGTAPFIYQWSCDQPDCGINDNAESILVNPTETANYQVVVSDANGIEVSASVPVRVADCSLVIPTGFTPNGDNINDTWELQNINTFEERLVEVYNRHGHRIFFSDTYSSAWDGTYNGDRLPSGTYYYRIELDAGSQSYQGKVTILQ